MQDLVFTLIRIRVGLQELTIRVDLMASRKGTSRTGGCLPKPLRMRSFGEGIGRLGHEELNCNNVRRRGIAGEKTGMERDNGAQAPDMGTFLRFPIPTPADSQDKARARPQVALFAIRRNRN